MAEVKKKKPAVDYSAVLNRLKDQSKRSDNDKKYITFEQGDTRVRILPGHPNMDAFFVEAYFHNKQTRKDNVKVRCLNNGDVSGDDCPICEEIRQYQGSRDKNDKKIWQEQRPKNRFYMNALERSDEEHEVKILACGTMVMTQLLGFVTDPDYGDITDVAEGLDIVINRTGEKLDTEYTVKPRRKSSPALPDEDEVAAIIGTNAKNTKLNDLTEIANQFDGEPENISFIWENGWDAFKEKMKDEADDDGGKPKKKKKPAPKDEDEDEDEEPVKPKKKVKPAPVEEDEEEDEAPQPKKKVKKPEPEEEEEEEEEEEAPKPKKKAKPAPVEDDDEDEDDTPPPPKKKKKAKPVEDDDDDDDLASLDAALAETRAKSKKKA